MPLLLFDFVILVVAFFKTGLTYISFIIFTWLCWTLSVELLLAVRKVEFLREDAPRELRQLEIRDEFPWRSVKHGYYYRYLSII